MKSRKADESLGHIVKSINKIKTKLERGWYYNSMEDFYNKRIMFIVIVNKYENLCFLSELITQIKAVKNWSLITTQEIQQVINDLHPKRILSYVLLYI